MFNVNAIVLYVGVSIFASILIWEFMIRPIVKRKNKKDNFIGSDSGPLKAKPGPPRDKEIKNK